MEDAVVEEHVGEGTRAGSAPSEPSPGPESDLAALKSQLQKNKSELDVKTSQGKLLEKDLAAMQTLWEGTTSALQGYEQAEAGLKKERADFKEYFDNKYGMVDGVLGKKKEEIDKLTKECEEEIKKAKDFLAGLEGQLAGKKKSLEEAVAAESSAKARYDALQGHQKSTKQLLGTLKGLQQQVEAEDDKKQIGRMYVLLKEFDKVLQSVEVTPVDKLKTKLQEAWKALIGAKEKARQEHQRWDAFQAELEAARVNASALEKSRLERLLEMATA